MITYCTERPYFEKKENKGRSSNGQWALHRDRNLLQMQQIFEMLV